MIEVNGIYKLKIIKNFGYNDGCDYKILAENGENVICEKINGEDAGNRYFFRKEFFIDPEKPNEIYSNIIITEIKK